jgi:hypothetical protein
MKNDELVVVNVNGGYASVYTFCDADGALEAIERAQKSAAETVATYESHIKNYPDRADYWRSCKAQYENAKYEVMTFDEFLNRQKKAMVSGEVTETTAERFEEMLNVLPPLKWCTIAGVEMFCMREMYTGTYTNQYARIGDKYYTAMVDVTDTSTWIHNRLKKSA